ncbi:hypothetical protein WJX84_009029 [Apatococcus fuscideae]|uniref:GST C-terminal domain-containing protein n=1 Tax=Apatococcus fuscideae TaxID=2026836 RepID=A0AAW1SI04_9CHLO
MGSSKPLYEIYVKGAPKEGLVNADGELGDCPFSQRTMMTFEEKSIPYKRMYVDEYHMGDIPWLKDVTEGACKIPFMKELETGKWYHDSDFMVAYLEDKFPKRKIGKPDTDPQVGKELFPTAFIEYLTTDGAGEKAKKDRLLAEFQKLEDYLAKHKADYFGGSDVCSTDLALSPRVKHILVGGKAVKGFELPASFKEVHACLMVAAAAKPLYEIYIKGAPEEDLVCERGELGDCPFSQRTMMTLEEKNIPYQRMYVDEYKMGEIPWLKDVTEGACQIPFMKELETGKWYHDSDFLVTYLEDKFPERKIGKPDTDPQVGKELFPTAFIEYLTTDGAGEKAKEERLLAEFQKLEDFLAEHKADYFGGSDVCSTDLALSPRVKHILVGGKAVKGFELPSSFKEVHAWLDRIQTRSSWKKCMPDEKWLESGWVKKREMEMSS